MFGRRSEKIDPDQLALLLTENELALGNVAANENMPAQEPGAAGRDDKPGKPRPRRNRGQLPLHLPRIEVVVDVADKTCRCCGGNGSRRRPSLCRVSRTRVGVNNPRQCDRLAGSFSRKARPVAFDLPAVLKSAKAIRRLPDRSRSTVSTRPRLPFWTPRCGRLSPKRTRSTTRSFINTIRGANQPTKPTFRLAPELTRPPQPETTPAAFMTEEDIRRANFDKHSKLFKKD